MAVKPKHPTPQLVKDFLPRFTRSSMLTIAVLEISTLAILAVILIATGAFEDNLTGLIVVLGIQALLGLAALFVLFQIIARPLQQVLAALIRVAGEPTATTPPNPSDTQFERNGLRPVLQTVYQLASTSGIAQTSTPTVEGQTSASSLQTLLGKALDQAICGFVIMNQNREIVYASQAAPLKMDTNGVRSLDLLFTENDTIEQWWEECEHAAVHAEKTWPRIPNKLPNEENRRFFDVIATYNKGAESEMVITLIDRTHLYEVGEAELDFIAFAAHELRGPITIIRGYTDVLAEELAGTLQEDQKELFRRLTVSANRLSGYINNILNTSRYDRRHLKMHLAETSIGAVYNSIKDDMALRASAQNRLLSVTIPEGLPTIAADTASLGEVFGNLIDNAIKYSNEGGAIEVTASSKGDYVELQVVDHGIGMPANVVSNLFQKFYRSHRSRETVAGTGIGLYISRAIVESHGGSISVRSEDGHGSTFVVSLPTYKTVADKLKAGNNGNETLIGNEGSWIKNHNMYRG